MIDDLRFAARRLAAHRGYALLAVITLALGVGGTTATYTVVSAVLFAPLPYGHAEELGAFWKKTDWTEEEFLFIRGRVPGFAAVALYRQKDVILREGDTPSRLAAGVSASAELFDVLGVTPLRGRAFRRGDDLPGAEPVAVLSFALWEQLGADPAILGARLTIDGTPRTVVGIMPRGFWFPNPAVRLWTPEVLTPDSRSWNSTLLGRVAAGHDVRAMAAPVAQLTVMLDERFDYPAQWDKTTDARITPLSDELTGAMRPALAATLAAMALILVIACANVAALMLGQIDARSVEFAVRSALGASRTRLTRQLLVEVLLVAVAAAALGAAVAWGGFGTLSRALPLGAWATEATPDWRVVAAATTIAAAAALLVVIVPSVSLHRGDLRSTLSRVRTAGIGGRGGHLENGLVVAEVALTVMIATAAMLLARSVAHLYAVDPGVRPDGVAVIDVVLPANLGRARRVQTIDELTAALGALPGVRSVGAAQTLPLRGGGYNLPASVDQRPDLQGITTEYRIVTPGYFETLGLTLLQGRTIGAADRSDAERIVVINEMLAQKYFGHTDPTGRRVGGDVGGPSARIVGLVGNAVERHLSDGAVPVRYVALAQMPWVDDAQSLVLRVAPDVDETSLLGPARRTIERIAPGIAVQQTTTMSRVLDTAIGPARQVVLLLSLLTALALTLGAVGVYGVIAHFAARRRRDWAIRVALGLPSRHVVTRVVAHGAMLVTAGIGVGMVAAAWLTRLLSALLYGVEALDPIAFMAAATALFAVGLIAALIPAWRAGMSDPLIALREP